MKHAPSDVIIRSFSTKEWKIEEVGDDSSVTGSCSFFIGRPAFDKKHAKSDLSFSQIINEHFSLSPVPLLGIQQGWDLCRRQHEIPFLSLFGVRRIWFYSVCLYGAYEEITAKTKMAKGTGMGGGEYYPVMSRNDGGRSWTMGLALSCDYFPQTDCIAFAKI